jgi:hypothetical protein
MERAQMHVSAVDADAGRKLRAVGACLYSLDSKFVVLAHKAVAPILLTCRNAQVADAIIGSVEVSMVYLTVWPFVMNETPRYAMTIEKEAALRSRERDSEVTMIDRAGNASGEFSIEVRGGS